jgi:hypothetical protein
LGTSNWQNISYNINLIRKINPESILDIGIGFGRWGFLFREFLEIWDNGNYSGKWKRRIDGVEIFPDYIKDYHNYFYDAIYFENATDFVKRNEKNYDLINCGDVIEHMDKGTGKTFIENCLKKCKYLLINIPIGKGWEQTAENENDYERHLSIWNNSDFKEYPYCKIKKFRDYALRSYSVILLSNKSFDYNKKYNDKYGNYFFAKNIFKNIFHFYKFIDSLSKYHNSKNAKF